MNNSERQCAICDKQSVEKYRPFCSSRCAQIDLNRWLSGMYTIPVALDDESEGDAGFDPS